MICKGLGQGSSTQTRQQFDRILGPGHISQRSCEDFGLGFTQDTMCSQNFTNPHTKETYSRDFSRLICIWGYLSAVSQNSLRWSGFIKFLWFLNIIFSWMMMRLRSLTSSWSCSPQLRRLAANTIINNTPGLLHELKSFSRIKRNRRRYGFMLISGSDRSSRNAILFPSVQVCLKLSIIIFLEISQNNT